MAKENSHGLFQDNITLKDCGKLRKFCQDKRPQNENLFPVLPNMKQRTKHSTANTTSRHDESIVS
jgi:hypothetical protein